MDPNAPDLNANATDRASVPPVTENRTIALPGTGAFLIRTVTMVPVCIDVIATGRDLSEAIEKAAVTAYRRILDGDLGDAITPAGSVPFAVRSAFRNGERLTVPERYRSGGSFRAIG